MKRAYVSIAADAVAATSDDALLGQLASGLPFTLEAAQRSAWQYQIQHLRELACELPHAHFFVEFLIPRMGRRADLIVLNAGIVFVVEYKVGARQFDRSGVDQVYGYGLDLKYFHETSHYRSIVPILVATAAEPLSDQTLRWDDDNLAHPLRLTPVELAPEIHHISRVWGSDGLDPSHWFAGRYKPTPTIVEAAQALYRGHDVEEISRSEAGAENLTRTAEYVSRAIESAKRDRRKIICFITGVPGSGKTLAGLSGGVGELLEEDLHHALELALLGGRQMIEAGFHRVLP